MGHQAIEEELSFVLSVNVWLALLTARGHQLQPNQPQPALFEPLKNLHRDRALQGVGLEQD